MTAPVVVVGVNSWVTVAQADDYFAAKWGATAWASLTLLQKTQLLISAVKWILQQNAFDLTMDLTTEIVKQAQVEAAWFIYSWYDEYEKRRALSSMGVTSYRALDFSETLQGVEFPKFLSDMLIGYTTIPASQFPRISRDVQGNASE